MKAFNNDPQYKADSIESAKQHRLADEFITGTYGRQNGTFKGCSVGCSVTDVNKRNGTTGGVEDHGFLAEQLGVPEYIIHLQDSIFEGLNDDVRPQWTERLFTAIEPGADLTPVLPVFLLKTLDRLPEQGRSHIDHAIKRVKEVLQNWADAGTVDIEAALKARDAAELAADLADLADLTVLASDSSADLASALDELAVDFAVDFANNKWEIIANDLISSIEEVQK